MWSHPAREPRQALLNVVTAMASVETAPNAAPVGRFDEIGRHSRSQGAPIRARAAAEGEPKLPADYGKPIAVIAPLEVTQNERRSDPSEFRNALRAMPHAFDVDF